MKNRIRWSDGVKVNLQSLIAKGGGAGRVESGGEGRDSLFEGGILRRGIGRVLDRDGRQKERPVRQQAVAPRPTRPPRQ